MNVFQIVAVLALTMLATATLRGAARGVIRKRMAVVWMLIWIGAAGAAIWPRGTAVVARAVGIGRGVDLVMYCSVFVMFIGFFYIYTRFRHLDHALTVLVRQLAIEHPVSREPRGQAPALPTRSEDSAAVVLTEAAASPPTTQRP
jgi:small membrane protein